MPIGDSAYGDARYGGESYTGTLPLTFNITTTSLPNATRLSAYVQSVMVFGGTAPYSWSLVSGSLPTGLGLDHSTGIISGIPTVDSFSSFTIGATDSAGHTDTQALSILVVAPAITAPIIGPPMSSRFEAAMQATNLEVVSYAEIWGGLNPVSTIQPVGPGLIYFGTGVKTGIANPTAIGNVLVLATSLQGASGKPAVTAVSGGGVTTWNRLAWSNPGSNQVDAELWAGVITATGPQSLTFTAATGSGFNAFGIFEFTTNGVGTWGFGVAGVASTNTGAVSNGTFPAIQPSSQGQLYLGCMATTAPGADLLNGTTVGYGYQTLSAVLFAYNLNTTQGQVMAPGWTTTPEVEVFSACSALLTTTAPIAQPQMLDGPIPLIGGSVVRDRNNAIRSSAQGIVILPDAAGQLLPVVSGGGYLYPDGAEMWIYRGCRYTDGTVEVARQGKFLITECDVNDDGTGVTLPTSMDDRGDTISRAKFTQPYQTDGVSTTDVAIQTLLSSVVPGLTFNFTPSTVVPPVSTWNMGDDPGLATQLAVGAAMELYPDLAGACALKPTPTPEQSAIAVEYIEGTNIAPEKFVRKISNVNVPNVIIATASGSGLPTPITAYWWDNNPSHKTFYAYGAVPAITLPVQDPTATYPTTVMKVDTSTLTTESDLFALLAQVVAQVQGAFETVQISVRADPARDVDDVVLCQRVVAGAPLPTPYVLDQVTIDLSASGNDQFTGRLVL